MQRLRVSLAVGVLLFAAGTSVAQAPPPAVQATATEKLSGLDDLAAEAMRQWKVPGLAMAVVQNGKVIYAKGYGYRDLGVVILTNLGGNKAPEVLAYNVYDRILGLDQLPWLSRFKDLDTKQKKGEDESKKSKSSDRKPGTHPSHDLKDYAGEYTNLGYGTVKIGLNGDALELKLNKLGPYPLPHYHYDIFEIPEDADSPFAGVRFQFQTNKQGEIDGVSAALEPALPEDTVFTRAPRKVSPGELEALVGDYNLGELTVTVSLANDVLHLSVPGQPQYELAPSKGLSFNIEGLPGYAVEFKRDSAGRVTEMVFNQPNGVFAAKRK